MHIFHLVPNMNFGGLQKVVRLLALGQRQRGHTVTIGCWTNESNHPEAHAELEAAGAHIIYLRRDRDGSLVFGRSRLFRSLKSQLGGVDVLHVHNPFAYFLYGALAGRAGRIKVALTLHATAMFDSPRFSTKRFWSAAMLSHGIVCVSSATQAQLQNQFKMPGKRFFVVDNGIDLDRFLAVPTRPRRAEFVFGSAGRMSKEKNHRLLIDAFALLLQKRSDVKLRFVGGGPLEFQLLEHVRELGIRHAAEFAGFTHDMAGFLHGLDAFVLPSDSEALPLTLLEAIASGIPVIATRVGGVPDIVANTDGGWLCPPKSPEAMAEAMETAMVDPNRSKRCERARRLVVERYSADRMVEDYERVYGAL